jgi:DNA-directed RNA polymerase subunit RPC12/RpoP
MVDRTCSRCGKAFRFPAHLREHQARKRPCADIVEPEDLSETDRDKPYPCKYCGRRFATQVSMCRHVRQACKIATSDEGMEKLMDHTLQRQMAQMEARMGAQIARLAELTELLGKQSSAPLTQHAESAATIVNGPVTQQNIKIDVVVAPWDDKRAIAVGVQEVIAAFAENTRLQEYARMSDYQLTDPEIAPPYVAEMLTDLVRRVHKDPTTRNIYLNPRRADQVLIHLRDGGWEVRAYASASQALLDGVATSIHEITLSNEKRRQLPLEAQNALAMAGLLYEDEPESYIERTRSSLVAHLTNMAPQPRKGLQQ